MEYKSVLTMAERVQRRRLIDERFMYNVKNSRKLSIEETTLPSGGPNTIRLIFVRTSTANYIVTANYSSPVNASLRDEVYRTTGPED